MADDVLLAEDDGADGVRGVRPQGVAREPGIVDRRPALGHHDDRGIGHRQQLGDRHRTRHLRAVDDDHVLADIAPST